MAKKPRSSEARTILNSHVSRRAVLAGAGAVVGAGALASCGIGGGSDSANSVRWGNWPLYLDVDDSGKKYPTLEAFTKETDIAVKYFEDYNDNDEFFGKVQAQLKIKKDIGYDCSW